LAVPNDQSKIVRKILLADQYLILDPSAIFHLGTRAALTA
jgi:hypothetical protein